jgi:hypothetical protein
MADFKILSARIQKIEELISLMKEDLKILQQDDKSASFSLKTSEKENRVVSEHSCGGKVVPFVTFGTPRKEFKPYVKPERWTEDNFFENMEKISYIKTFKDGSKKKVVNPPSRALWPTVNGVEYAKVQELCADYGLDCIRDESPADNEYKPFVFIVLEHLSE